MRGAGGRAQTSRVRVVVDTNVVVSAALNPGRTPDLCLAALRAEGCTVLLDEAVEGELREVLARPKFRGVDPRRREALIALICVGAERVREVPRSAAPMVDEGDRAFVDLAIAGRADVVLTGNARHYPEGMGFEVLSPAALLARFGR